MNKLLERQIKKYLGEIDVSNSQIQEFIKAVSDTYDSAENDQDLMDRSLDISSKEMIERDRIHQERELSNERAIAMLKSAVVTLDPNAFIESVQHNDATQEVIRLAQYLSNITVKYKQNMYELTIQKVHAESLSYDLQIYKFAVENAADYIIILDADLKIIYANTIALVGAKLEDLLGKTVDEAYSSLGINGTTEQLNEHKTRGDKQFTSEISLNRRYNEVAIIQVNSTISTDAQNRKLFINIARDITKERALETEKEEFLSIASHELRTPMTIIRGYISLLGREQLGELNIKQKEILDKMNTSTVNLIKFATEMLDLSKLDAGKFTVNPIDCPIENMLTDAMERMRVLFDAKGIISEVHINPAQIKTDPVQFDRIMSNLLYNAYKFTPKGGTVAVSNQINDETKLVTVCISDTGIGIPAVAVENLFKKFSQVDNVLQRQSGGSGLGLVISKGLVEALGGTIWVESKLGEGSKFFFTMPKS